MNTTSRPLLLSQLTLALDALNSAGGDYEACCQYVWRLVGVIDPALAAAVRALWPDEALAARWMCTPRHHGKTPADWVAVGCSEEVMAMLVRTQHGVGA
ncbi:MAG: DUF2384 domain-containing protein [Proteobacteria bacterium]|nr:DUF2384 domain-containing protein [Pseudomonadota bacterium]